MAIITDKITISGSYTGTTPFFSGITSSSALTSTELNKLVPEGYIKQYVDDLQEWTYLNSYTGGTIDVSAVPTGCTVRVSFYCKNNYGAGANKDLQFTLNAVGANYDYRRITNTTIGTTTNDTKIVVFQISTASVALYASGDFIVNIDADYDSSHLTYYIGYNLSNFITNDGFNCQELQTGYNDNFGSTRLKSIEIGTGLDNMLFKVYYKPISY